LHSRWKRRTLHAARAGLLLYRFGDELFMAASGDEGRRVRCPTYSQALKETAARHRHGDPSFSYRTTDENVDDTVSNLLKRRAVW
jgi:hypothetical protein